VITLGRVAAVALSVSTFVFLFLHDSWRSDNLFLVPDLLLCLLLLVAAALPAKLAGPALLGAFAFASGVLATSVSSYAVDGRLGVASLFGAVAAAVVAGAVASAGRYAGPDRRDAR
jgi:hypothetical protein